MPQEQVTRTEILEHVSAAFGIRALGRDEIVYEAQRTGARSQVIAVLRDLPVDYPYTSVRDLWVHLDDVPVCA